MRPDGTFLAFDYGERRIGVAVGQSVTGTASPLATVAVREGEPDWASIDGIVADWKPDGLVVGEPLQLDGRPQAMTRHARRFGHALRSRFGLPVHAADERLSTVEARAELAARGAFRGRNGRRRNGIDHPVAARIILESWLGERRSDPSGPGRGTGTTPTPAPAGTGAGPTPTATPAGTGAGAEPGITSVPVSAAASTPPDPAHGPASNGG